MQLGGSNSRCLLLSSVSGLGICEIDILRYPCVQNRSGGSRSYRALQALARDTGYEWICTVTVSARHRGTWNCHGKHNLHRERALDPPQIELFTWLVTRCCGLTWKCMDTQRGCRAQTLWVSCFCDYTPGVFNIQMQLQLNSTFFLLYSSREIWNSLVTLRSCFDKETYTWTQKGFQPLTTK